MTLACAIVTIEKSALIAVADGFARAHGLRHLIVESGGNFVGVVCRCDFVGAGPDDVVADHMARRILVISPDTDIGSAAALMAHYGVGCLPVLDGDRLCGVITRGDLRRSGVDEERLGAGKCTRCGSLRGVCAGRLPAPTPELCLDCHRARA